MENVSLSNIGSAKATELIPIKENDGGQVVVSGRELYEFLQIKTHTVPKKGKQWQEFWQDIAEEKMLLSLVNIKYFMMLYNSC